MWSVNSAVMIIPSKTIVWKEGLLMIFGGSVYGVFASLMSLINMPNKYIDTVLSISLEELS